MEKQNEKRRGELIFVSGTRKKQTAHRLEQLIVALLEKQKVGYLVTKKEKQERKLFMLNNNISQVKISPRLKAVKKEINRQTVLYENPIIVIRNLHSIRSKKKKAKVVFKKTVHVLKKAAEQNKILIIAEV
jgi:hypothetical protein